MDKSRLTELKREVPRLLIIAEIISLVGWCFEKIGRLLVYGASGDRGFLRLPLCPIYGISVVAVYLLCGTPDDLHGVIGKLMARSKRVEKSRILRYVIYFAAVFVLATSVELVTGLVAKAVGITLWDYSDRFLNLWGVVCLGYSLLWGGLITLFMGFLWKHLYKLISKIPSAVTAYSAFFVLAFVCVDFLARCAEMINLLASK